MEVPVRAVKKNGATVGFLSRARRDGASAGALFERPIGLRDVAEKIAIDKKAGPIRLPSLAPKPTVVFPLPQDDGFRWKHHSKVFPGKLRGKPDTITFNQGGEMSVYRSDGSAAFSELASALTEELAIAQELSHCAKVEVYHLLAADIYDRISAARAKTLATYQKLEKYKT